MSNVELQDEPQVQPGPAEEEPQEGGAAEDDMKDGELPDTNTTNTNSNIANTTESNAIPGGGSNQESMEAPISSSSGSGGGSNSASKSASAEDVGESIFTDEAKAAYAWTAWIGIYWTIVILIPTLSRGDFGHPGFFMWIVGLLACMGCAFSVRAGLYPSGATEEHMNAYDGRGRYAAVFLLFCLALDFCGLAFYTLNDGTDLDQYFRGVCHWISMIWGSLFYFNRFYQANPDIAIYAFPLEWADIMLTCLVIFLLYRGVNDEENESNEDDSNCWSEDVCVVYFVFLTLQLVGWICPMALLPNWGAQPNAKGVALHLFVLDLTTNLPIIITICVTEGYLFSAAVFFDCVYKTVGLVRSVSYYMVFYVWLDKGLGGAIGSASKSLTQKNNSRPGVPASNELR